MCKSDAGSTCDMNLCEETAPSKVNYAYVLVIAVCVFVAIFVFCIFVCFKFYKSDYKSRRPTAEQLNDGVVEMVPVWSHFGFV